MSCCSLEACEKFFHSADTDGDGYLSYEEMKVMLTSNGYKGTEEDLRQYFITADTSGDNKISLQEYLAVMGKVPAEDVKGAAMRRIFKSFDKDGNDVIDSKEFKEIYAQIGVELSPEELERAMARVDTDKDGVINYEEFIAFCFCKK